MIGMVLDNRYELVEFIGQGGMALVYKALDQRSHHFVAVKILKPEYNNDQEFLARFEREATAASKVSHHNIVNLLDVGNEGAYRYLVLEYIEGRTLKEIIDEKGALSPTVAVQITIRILSALQHMHNNGIIHRDIKPQNILIHAEGHVKVSDFGIARMADVGTIGKTDMVMGSVHYFSPEQAQGQDVTAASDIYSVGVVLYEMLTGSVPFDGETPVAIAMQHLQVAPRTPHILNPDVPEAIEAVVLKALEKKPTDRYQQAQDMARELQNALTAPAVKKSGSDGTTEHIRRLAGKEPPRGRRNFSLRHLIELALILVTTALIVFLSIHMYRGIVNATSAPYVVGETEDAAIRMIAHAGLSAEVTRASDPNQEAGTVIMQSPDYDTSMRKGEKVFITVSTGPAEQLAPQLYGMNVERARAEAEKYGFILLILPTKLVSERSVDDVLEQSPAAGEPLSSGGIIQVSLSGGSVIIPDLTGKTQAEALALTEKLGLQITDIQTIEVEDPAKDNIVATQLFLLADGTPARVGDKVIEGTGGSIVVYTLKTN